MASLKCYYRITVREKGKIVYRKQRASKSFVIQFLEALYGELAGVSLNITNIAGTEDSWTAGADIRGSAPSGETEEGILVGSGTTPPTNTDYCMATQIMHGTGSGQLQYGAQAISQPGEAAGNVDMVMSRAFLNGSGAAITVREIGFAVGEGTVTPTTTTGRLAIRDVLPSPVTVNNGATLTVEYIIRTTA